MKTILEMHGQAREAVASMHCGQITYEAARAIVEAYIKAANVEGKAIAARHGIKFRPLSVIAFMR